MLFDPKWDPLSLPAFIAWLETKDPNERYDWCSAEHCACGQYFSQTSLGLRGGWLDKRSDVLNELAQGNGRTIWTFGALLSRARAAL